jgi:hypothetical protein
MNLRVIWPRISDGESARRAIKDGFWAAIIVVFFDVVIAAWALAARQKFAGYYDAWILVDGVLFAIVAWRMWRNSRIWSVIGLLLMALEIEDKLRNAASTFGVVTVFLFLAFLNAARGAFAFHKYSIHEAPPGVTNDVATPSSQA